MSLLIALALVTTTTSEAQSAEARIYFWTLFKVENNIIAYMHKDLNYGYTDAGLSECVSNANRTPLIAKAWKVVTESLGIDDVYAIDNSGYACSTENFGDNFNLLDGLKLIIVD